jgi:hypothetical protein
VCFFFFFLEYVEGFGVGGFGVGGIGVGGFGVGGFGVGGIGVGGLGLQKKKPKKGTFNLGIKLHV